MMFKRRHRRARPSGRLRAGIAMIEAVLSSIVVGLMFVAALRLIVATRAGQTGIETRHIASHLASDLMAEILSKPYDDPDGLSILGIELAEDAAATRSTFDDVDDYHGLRESPPRDRDGVAMSHLTGWTRAVTVEYAAANDPKADSLLDAGAKRITITVTHHDVPVCRMTAIRTRAADR